MMAYLIDRQQVVWGEEVVAIINTRQRRARSQVVLRDNSLYDTKTRSSTIVQRAGARPGIFQQRHRGVTWWIPG